MLSILIPTFNDPVYELVKEIHLQCCEAKITFEILVFDDASTNSNCTDSNLKINTFSHTNYTILKQNIGRSAVRNKLAQTAKFDWLLFLDADVLPNSRAFISSYLQQDYLEYDVVFGGFTYDEDDYSKQCSLRWRYGQKYEQKKAVLRNDSPTRHTISANVLIKKSKFIALNLEEKNRYGMDIRFGVLLKQFNCLILHIDNEVIHKGLESNSIFIEKTEQSILTLLYFFKKDKIKKKDHKLLKFYFTLRNLNLHLILRFTLPFLLPCLKINLQGNYANPALLQCYKLLYLSKHLTNN